MFPSKDPQILAGEVTEVIYTSDEISQLYGIKYRDIGSSVRSINATSTANDHIAIPLNLNNIRIPIVGEIVLVMLAPNSYASSGRPNKTQYYIDVVSLQHNINHNSVPTLTKTTGQTNQASTNPYDETSAGNTQTSENNPETDPNFKEKSNIAPLQPFPGDTIISGRFGSSLRFSSNAEGGKFTVQPKFKGTPGNPITILRNSVSKEANANKFIVEDFSKEDNILVLASGQQLEFKQSSNALKSITSKQINTWKAEKWGATPQTLISSGRIVFNSTQKEIIAFAKNGIGLSSETNVAIDARRTISLNASKIEIGDLATEPLVLGTQLQLWLTNLITQLGLVVPIHPVVGPCLPLAATPTWPAVQALLAQAPVFLSNSAFTTKQTSV